MGIWFVDGFFPYICRPFQPNLSGFFSFDILNIINFNLAMFVTTKEELLTLDQAALPKLTQMGQSILFGEKDDKNGSITLCS